MLQILAATVALTSIFACLLPTSSPNNTTVTATASTGVTAITLPGGPMSARVIMQTGSSGSFATPTTGGTVNAAMQGWNATQLFTTAEANPNSTTSTLLATYGSASWPAWLTRFEVGLSGSSNAASQNPGCAAFASSSESTELNCQVNPAPSPMSACGAPSGMFRVSEYDCNALTPAPTASGTGGDSDGVYLRAYFNRDTSALGPTENIMVVIQYAASALDGGPSLPNTCFNSQNQLVAENCSDFTWQSFLRVNGLTAQVQPFLLMVPPFSGVLNQATGTSGTGIMTKQIVLPLATNPNLNVFELSRTGTTFTSPSANFTKLQTLCGPDSPLCAGIVFYAVSFYRI